MRRKMSVEDCFFGSSTVGERGQIVIPAEARHELGINPGDKVLIVRDPVKEGLMVFKIDAAREFLDEMRKMLEQAEKVAQEADDVHS